MTYLHQYVLSVNNGSLCVGCGDGWDKADVCHNIMKLLSCNFSFRSAKLYNIGLEIKFKV